MKALKTLKLSLVMAIAVAVGVGVGVSTPAVAQQTAVSSVPGIVDRALATMDAAMRKLQVQINQTALELFSLMIFFDLVFFLVFNVSTIANRGMEAVLTTVFSKIVIWLLLAYAIRELAGPDGAETIRRWSSYLFSLDGRPEDYSGTGILKKGAKLSIDYFEIVESRMRTKSWTEWGGALFVSILNGVAVTIMLVVFATLAVKVILFSFGSTVTMMFASVAFALAGLEMFRNQAISVLTSAIRMALYLASVYIVALLVYEVLTVFIEEVTKINEKSMNVTEAMYMAFALILVSVMCLYLSITLPNFVQQMISGTGVSGGERAGDMVPALAASAIGFGAGVGFGGGKAAFGKAAGALGGGKDKGGGGSAPAARQNDASPPAAPPSVVDSVRGRGN